jgi:hypothetical protein
VAPHACRVTARDLDAGFAIFYLRVGRAERVIVDVTKRPTRSAHATAAVVTWVALAVVVPDVQAEEPVLFLSPVEALSIIRQRPAAPPLPPPARALHDLAVPAAPAPSIVPPRFHVPDLYAIDFDRDAPRFADPIDRDRLVAIEAFSLEQYGVGMFLDYDEESYPMGEDSNLFAVRFERSF